MSITAEATVTPCEPDWRLIGCADCRRLLAGLRATLDALQRLPAPSGGADALGIAAAVRVRLREPPRPD
ncbi:MAG: hypothetical protein ACLP0J_06870 [Solirubrobacteraceae bacterium]